MSSLERSQSLPPAIDPSTRSPYTQRQLLARFWLAAAGLWAGNGSRSVWMLTAFLLASALLQLGIQFRLNLWGRDFFDAFGLKDEETLRRQAVLFLPLAGISILVAAFTIWARMTLQRLWRAWLTQHLIDRWLATDRFRQLRFMVGEDQNPEYRLAEDVRIATDSPVYLVVGLLNAFLGAVIFIGVLWSVGGDLTVEVFGKELTVPKYLVIAVTIYSVLLTVAMVFIGRRLVGVIALKNAAEAQFRSAGSRLRDRVSLAPEGEEHVAQHRLLSRSLDDVIASWRDLCFQFMRMTMLSQGNILLAPVIAWGLCAPKYLVGTMSLGEVAQVTAAFVIVQAALNWLVENYAGVADCLSSVNRVASFLLALDHLEEK